jgi:hypothetical protein
MKRATLLIPIPILKLNIGDTVYIDWDKGIGSYVLIKDKWHFIAMGSDIDIYDNLYFEIDKDE